uniref:Histone-lysine N-methyltransferase SETMAR n=1 Tax=Haemonchus contortus TaxID=6289 RepID=A0A7I4YAE2_HAECO
MLLERNATVNKQVYFAQLNSVNEAIRLKRPYGRGQVILLHENIRPHIAPVVKTALQELEGEVLQHSQHSSDLAPSDYHLLRSMLNQIGGVTFDGGGDLKNWLNKFFDTTAVDFWRIGINKLVEGWEEVGSSNGGYIIG